MLACPKQPKAFEKKETFRLETYTFSSKTTHTHTHFVYGKLINRRKERTIKGKVQVEIKSDT